MKINFKARIKNKTFLISASVLIVSFVYSLMALFDIVPSVNEKQVTELITMAVNVLALAGVIVDPTTKGFNDSDRAMTYYTPYDINNEGGNN